MVTLYTSLAPLRRPLRMPVCCVFITLASAPACCPPTPVGLRVLMVTDSQPAVGAPSPLELARRLTERGEMTVELAHDASSLDTAGLDRYDVLLFDVCRPSAPPPATRRSILEATRSGIGLVAMHRSLSAYLDWPEWTGLLGVAPQSPPEAPAGAAPNTAAAPAADRHHPVAGLPEGDRSGSPLHAGETAGPNEYVVLDPHHPAMRGLGGWFTLDDPPVHVHRLDPGSEILIRTAGGTWPQVWARPCDQGRVYAIAIAHDAQTHLEEWFLTMLHRGIRWAARDLPEPLHNALRRSESQAGFELLFNGRDLTGWTADTACWTVENGELIGRINRRPPFAPPTACLEPVSVGVAPASRRWETHAGRLRLVIDRDRPSEPTATQAAYLTTSREFGDFELRFAVRINSGHAGLVIRSPAAVPPADGETDRRSTGYEIGLGPGRYGSLYTFGQTPALLADGFTAKAAKAAIPDGWNDLTVRAVGARISVTVNGVTTVEYEPNHPAAVPTCGTIALKLPAGEAAQARFRSIRIQPLTQQPIQRAAGFSPRGPTATPNAPAAHQAAGVINSPRGAADRTARHPARTAASVLPPALKQTAGPTARERKLIADR